jgi:hypothetical protein
LSESVAFLLQIVKLPDSEKTAPGYTQNIMLCNCFSPLVIRLDGTTCGFVADKGLKTEMSGAHLIFLILYALKLELFCCGYLFNPQIVAIC